MALTKQEWEEIAVLYKVGEMPIRDIADRFGITHGAIQAKAKRENWERGSLKSAVNELAKQTSQISQMVTHGEAEVLTRVIKDKTELSNLATEIVSDAIQLQQSIVKGTLSKLQAGSIDELQASKVLQSLGLTFESIRELFNLDGNVTTNQDKEVVINIIGVDPEEKQDDDMVIQFVGVRPQNQMPDKLPDDPIEASRVYMELMRNG